MATIRRPSTLLGLLEVPRAIAELGTWPLAAPALATAPRGDGHPVMVLPGFVADDASTRVLRHFLRARGHNAGGWELGRNLGPKAIGAQGEALVERVLAWHATSGRTVSLVGWSLGGIMARIIARRVPHAVRQVVTFGSPFSGDPRATNVWRAYELLAGQRVDDPVARSLLAEGAGPLDVPSSAIFSRDDGIVAWQNCCGTDGDRCEGIEVRGTHLGLASNPAVLYAVADRLALPEGEWRRFRPTGLHGLSYPTMIAQAA